MKRILVCAGTRPEIIKMAPVYHALKRRGATALVLHTGQHEEMAWPLYRFFGMQPHMNLTLRRKGASLAHLSASVLEQAADAMEILKPEAVLVQGDTSSAFKCALAAFYARIPVGHVEAGLRTYETDPFPEEKNRELIGRIAHWHFTPTPRASLHLEQEFIRHHVTCVGNTVVDAVQLGLARLAGHEAEDEAGRAVDAFLKVNDGRQIVLVTAHRRENWGAPMASIARAVCRLIDTRPDVVWIWPMHLNPELRAVIRTEIATLTPVAATRLLLTEPLNYPSLLAVLNAAYLVLTDSGGIQEEAASLRRPVVVMRESTERQELIEAGGGVLVGADESRICVEMARLLDDPAAYAAMQVTVNPFGDGLAADRIVDLLGVAA